MSDEPQYTVIVPAAGVGSRMQADRPKQYLQIAGKSILQHTLEVLISHSQIAHIIVAIDPRDPYFNRLEISSAPWITRVDGGSERADSVLNGLTAMPREPWVLVHDAARPCVKHRDISSLIDLANRGDSGGILAVPVKDTMKRAFSDSPHSVSHTEARDNLWHALTPQFFPTKQLNDALAKALEQGVPITDEASAIEWAGGKVNLIEGNANNIKITRPEDLSLAEFFMRNKPCE
jgi:2-C-methyl-D-erythritol 4-phosphate cytidylyltransferase